MFYDVDVPPFYVLETQRLLWLVVLVIDYDASTHVEVDCKWIADVLHLDDVNVWSEKVAAICDVKLQLVIDVCS